MLSVCLSGVLTLVQKLPIVSLSCSSTLRHHFMSCPSNSPVSFFPTASSSTFPTLTRPTPLACPQSLSNHSTFCPSPTLQQLSRPNYIRSRRVKETELCDWGGRGHDGLFEIFVASEPDVGLCQINFGYEAGAHIEMFSLRRFARAPTLFLFLLVLLLASCATFLLFTLRLEGTPHYQDNRRLSPQNRRGPPPMANFSRQSKRRPLNLATRLTRFEQTDQSTFSSLQPDSLLFPYPLSTGKVRVFSYFSLPSGALPFTRAVQPCPELFVVHQVSSGFVCETNTKPGAGILCYGERLVFYPKLVTMSRVEKKSVKLWDGKKALKPPKSPMARFSLTTIAHAF